MNDLLSAQASLARLLAPLSLDPVNTLPTQHLDSYVSPTTSGWWCTSKWQWWDQSSHASMVTPTALLTTLAYSCTSSAQCAFSVVSDSSVLATSITSTPRTTLSSGTLATTWCSPLTSCTIAFQPITSKSTTSLQLRWWRSTRSCVVRCLLSVRNTVMRWRELYTQLTATTFTSRSAVLMMTRSREWRIKALSELYWLFKLYLSHSYTLQLILKWTPNCSCHSYTGLKRHQSQISSPTSQIQTTQTQQTSQQSTLLFLIE